MKHQMRQRAKSANIKGKNKSKYQTMFSPKMIIHEAPKTKSILQRRLIEEFENQLQQFTQKINPNFMVSDETESDRRNDKSEQRTKEITANSFKIFLKQIEIFDFKQNKNEQLFVKIINILTPVESAKPILTCRNIRAIFYAILSHHEEWMAL